MTEHELDIRKADIEGSIIDFLFEVAVPFADHRLILTKEQFDRFMKESAVHPRFNQPFDWKAKKDTDDPPLKYGFGSYRFHVKETDEPGS